MPASRRALSFLVAGGTALLLIVTACTSAPTQTQSANGVLVDVSGASLQTLESFTLRTNDGQELVFTPADTFNRDAAHVMTPGHMRQHMALAIPVTVTYREEDGQLVALSATD